MKARVPVEFGGKKVYFFYSFACGAFLVEKYGSPTKADVAFNKAIFANDGENFILDKDKCPIGKSGEDFTAEDFNTLRNYVTGLTLTWAKETGKEAIDLFDESLDDLPTIILAIAKAIGFAMPEPDGKEHPQTP